jgi:deoxyribodipyrimidine photolyase-related protein
MCTREEFKNWLDPDVPPLMNHFYNKQRVQIGVLLDQSNRPLGGKWNYDSENRKKIPKKFEVESFIPKTLESKNIDDVKAIVNNNFSSHPGDIKNYWIPTNRKTAIKWFKDYLDERFVYFGRFQDAIDDRAPFLYHSLISPFINIGFITPKEVIREVENRLNEDNLNDVEGFIRQVLGWREFVRGIYQNYSEHEESMNFFDHKRKLSDHWYNGTTGVTPLDDVIKKSNEWGYSHHIERLMITGNLMLMLQVDPVEVHKWFMEMYVDSSDWVMGPNVYGMSQFSDGGLFATKPYFSGSNYILKMSNYPKGDWCDAVDGLYWQFIENNKSFFANNFRMAMMVKTVERMDSEKKDRIFKAANKLRAKITK